MTKPLSRSLKIFIPHCSDVLTDTLPHGDGQIAYGFLRRLAERGHELHVATPRLEVQATLPPNFHVYVLDTRRGGLLGRAAYMLQLRRLFRRLTRQHRFDLMHQMNPVFTGISLALRGSTLPLVLGTYVARWPSDPDAVSSVFGRLRHAFGTRLLNTIALAQQEQADLLLVTAPAAFNRLTDPTRVASKIRMIGHGIDATLFSPAPGFDAPGRFQAEQLAPRVLFLANIWRRKGIIPLIDAWAIIAAQLPHACLDVIGDGPDLPAMQEHVRSLNLDRSVNFLGNVSRSSTPRFYRACTLFVSPSIGEPYGTAPIEAMACGCPVVVTDAGGSPAIVPPTGGLRVPVNDAPALASAILQLLNDPDQRRAMAISNRSHVLSTFDWPCIIDALEGFYAELVPTAAADNAAATGQ